MYKTSMLNKFAAGKKQGHSSSGGTSMLLSKIVMTLVYTTNY